MADKQAPRPGQRSSSDTVLAVAILLLGAFLAWSGAHLAQRLHSTAVRRQSLTFEDHIGVAANTIGLIVVVWWALSFLIAVVSVLLERAGSRRAAAAAGKFSPAFMRRLVLAAVGLQLATAPLAHASGGPEAADPARTPPAASAAWVPGGGLLQLEPGARPRTADPAPKPPTPSPGPGTLSLDPRWTPAPPPVDPGTLAAAQLREQEPAAAEVTVRAGDSLWSLCAAELGPLASDVDLALAWPRLYHANRDVIGPDPGLLFPGQVLRIPAGLSMTSSDNHSKGTP